MPTTLTNLNDVLISQQALLEFVLQLAPLKAFSTSYDVTAALRGSTITVPIISNITATTAENQYESADSGTMTGRDLTLTNYRRATVSIKDSQWHNSSVADISRFSSQLSASVASAFTSQLFGLITSTNFPSAVTGVTAASFGLAGVRAARLALTNNNAPRDERSIVLNPVAYNSVLSDLSSAMVYGSPDAIQLGAAPENGPLKVYGLNVYESTALPAGLIGFAAHPAAMAVAVRPLMPQDQGLLLECKVVSDKQSGLSYTYRRHYATGTGIHWASAEALMGYGVGVTNGLVRITT
jgi:hypothetical protein